MSEQLELFSLQTGLIDEDAWIVAKQYCLGDISYKRACNMVKNIKTLDEDIEYFHSICH